MAPRGARRENMGPSSTTWPRSSNVKGGGVAMARVDNGSRERLRHLLQHGHGDDPDLFRAAPDGVAALVPSGWLWRPDAPRHRSTQYGLADPRAYTCVRAGSDDLRPLLRSSESALSSGASPTSTDDDQVREYVRCSVDVTMKGGTTSGVVYPLAVCEIARRAVLRNIGGSSAGAIAAAGAAAAELGRASLLDRPDPVSRSAAEIEQGRVRTGFAGLADVAGWLAEVDCTDDKERHRLGQLFRPAEPTRAVFRVVAALMQAKLSRIPWLLLGALSPVARAITVLLVLVAPAVVGAASPGPLTVAQYLVAAAWLTVVAAFTLGAALTCLLARLRRRPRTPREGVADLREPVRASARPTAPSLRLAVTALVIGVLGAGGLIVLGFGTGVAPEVWPLVTVSLLSALGVVAAQLLPLRRLLLNARSVRFGLIAGSDARPVGARARARSIWDRVAGLPAPTVGPALADWLTDALNDLAGLGDDEVLRFGHLWQGPSFSTAADLAVLRRAADLPQARQINLELMTTDVVRGLPLRFPLQVKDVRADDGQPRLLVRRSDLDGPQGQLLPAKVIDAICVGTPVQGLDSRTGEHVSDLYALPLPWDLPVVFAVRMSLSFPVLFQAVRLYERHDPGDVRDDFGVRLARAGVPLRYPASSGPWVSERWISDGGITSNFPIHFFDSVLPRWPTLGINLGDHPDGAAHQDVWLPSDADRVEVPTGSLNGSLVSFVAGVLSTGLKWRDTVQTAMPAFRGRVATVRTKPGEGGSNVFMTRDQVAGLSLRGALAGVRLSRRFSSQPHWHRHEYLRARVGLDNLASLSGSLRAALACGEYPDWAVEGSRWRAQAMDEGDQVRDPTASHPRHAVADDGVMDWFDPAPAFWAAAGDLLGRVSGGAVDGLHVNAPWPAPDLVQVPRQ